MQAASPSASRLHEALLEYSLAPGRYQLSLREPAVLFTSVREILHIAAGRGAAAPVDEELRQAAIFFIRAALLYPGADHYAVLGYPSRAEPDDAKERYRLLMRLTHPDFAAAGSAPWPADAAVRVNRAYEILSSPVLRRDYDEQLGPARPAAPAASASGPQRSVPALRRSEAKRSAAGKKWMAAVAVVLAASGIALLLPRSEPDQLVQKPLASLAQESAAPVRHAPAAGAHASVPGGRHASAPQAPVTLQDPRPETRRVAEVQERAPAPPVAVQAVPHAPAQHASAQHALAPPALAPALALAPAPAPVSATAPPKAVSGAPSVEPHEPARPMEASLPPPVRAVEAMPAVPSPALPPPVAIAPPTAPPDAAALPIPLAPVPPGPAPGVLPVARANPSPPIANSAAPAPTLADAQPVLTQLLQTMESGSGEQVLRLLDANARQAPGARGLSRQFDRVAAGRRPVHVSHVEFQGEAREGVLLVTGRMRLHAGEPAIGARGQKFVVRAEFVNRGGKAMLTGLSGAAE